MENNISLDIKEEIEMRNGEITCSSLPADNTVFIKKEDEDLKLDDHVKKEEDPLHISEFSTPGESSFENLCV